MVSARFTLLICAGCLLAAWSCGGAEAAPADPVVPQESVEENQVDGSEPVGMGTDAASMWMPHMVMDPVTGRTSNIFLPSSGLPYRNYYDYNPVYYSGAGGQYGAMPSLYYSKQYYGTMPLHEHIFRAADETDVSQPPPRSPGYFYVPLNDAARAAGYAYDPINTQLLMKVAAASSTVNLEDQIKSIEAQILSIKQMLEKQAQQIKNKREMTNATT